jgi:hypothetical protein
MAKKKSDPPKERPAPRATQYTDELGKEICSALARGEPLKAICKLPGMPKEELVREWGFNPDHPFSARYHLAKQMGYHKIADELLEISDDTKSDFLPGRTADGKKIADEKAISRSRLMVDTRKWLLSKMLPRVYGDKLEVGGKDGGPIQVEHSGMTDLEAARRMVLMLFEQVTAEGGSHSDALKMLNGEVAGHDPEQG